MSSFANASKAGKLQELVETARKLISTSQEVDNAGEIYWQAYVALERAVLHLKLTEKLDETGGAASRHTMPRAKGSNIEELLTLAKAKLESLDVSSKPEDPAALLLQLRECRNVVKALVANYDRLRRSTTS